MRRQPDLMINGILLPVRAAADIRQTYSYVAGGFSDLRLGDGALLHQEAWRKVSTQIAATGLVPAALDSIDWTTSVQIGCIATRARQASIPEMTLPAARRVDATPYGFGLVGERLVPTVVTLAGNDATLAPVAGASGYTVLYYPLLTVQVTNISERFDAKSATADFDLTAEEI